MYRSYAVASVGALSAGSVLLLCSLVSGTQAEYDAAIGLLLLGVISAGYYHLATAQHPSLDLHAHLATREPWQVAAQADSRLGELLVYRYRWLRKADLDRALALQKQTGRKLGEILLDLRVISPVRLAHALQEQRRLRYASPLSEHEANWAEPGEA